MPTVYSLLKWYLTLTCFQHFKQEGSGGLTSVVSQSLQRIAMVSNLNFAKPYSNLSVQNLFDYSISTYNVTCLEYFTGSQGMR